MPEELLAVAGLQDGVISRDQALAAGLTPADLWTLVRNRTLRPLHRATYALAGHPAGPRQWARSAALSVGNGWASGPTAARLLGVELAAEPMWDEVTQLPSANRIANRRELKARFRLLDAADVTEIDGIPVVAPSRLGVELPRHFDRLTGVWGCEQLLRRGVPPEEILGRLRRDEHEARRRLASCRPLSESALETTVRLEIVGGGLPEPALQHLVRDPDGHPLARLDMAYDELRIGVEADGRRVHGAPEALFRDRSRQNSLVALGWVVLRFTWDDLGRRGSIAAAVRAALRRPAA